MANDVISFPVNLRKNKNQYNAGYGNYYAEADAKDPLNLKGFARHLSDHGKLVDYPMAVLVLQNIVSCLKELVTQGQPVKLDGFGTFSPTIESDGKKAVSTVEGSLEVGIDNLIAGVHLRFTPENSKGEKLTSRALKEECTVFFVGCECCSVAVLQLEKVNIFGFLAVISIIMCTFGRYIGLLYPDATEAK